MKQRSAHVVNEHQSSSNKEGDCKLAAHRLGVCMRRGPLRLALGASCGAQLTATPAARAHHHRRRLRSAARSAALPGPRRCRWPGRRARARQSAAARPHAAPPALATQTEPSLWLTHPSTDCGSQAPQPERVAPLAPAELHGRKSVRPRRRSVLACSSGRRAPRAARQVDLCLHVTGVATAHQRASPCLSTTGHARNLASADHS